VTVDVFDLLADRRLLQAVCEVMEDRAERMKDGED
jgi:hypothetical protein